MVCVNKNIDYVTVFHADEWKQVGVHSVFVVTLIEGSTDEGGVTNDRIILPCTT